MAAISFIVAQFTFLLTGAPLHQYQRITSSNSHESYWPCGWKIGTSMALVGDLGERGAFCQAIEWCRISPEVCGICLSSCKCVCELQERICQHTKVPRWLFQGRLISAVFALKVPQRSESRFLVASLNMAVQNWASYWHSQPMLFNYRWIHGRRSSFPSDFID